MKHCIVFIFLVLVLQFFGISANANAIRAQDVVVRIEGLLGTGLGGGIGRGNG